ncbi:hypothetical protein [Pleurocapsa sp. PCC 7319]|uniref:hypothetical protein n=1 Tax=Pleurocapsa sp. PCC 7319 TaxID=118161 RepID=UPI00034C74AB|nr:hypothetical protein [Pleurocapsa sp. PCC 7319]
MKSFLETWSKNDTNSGNKETASELQHKSEYQHINKQQQQYQEIFDFCQQNNLDVSNINAFNSAETIVLG